MDKEDQLLLRRLLDLADASYGRNIPVYTDFLNLHEQTVFLSAMPQFSHVRVLMDGGYDGAERKIVCFLPVYMEEAGRESLPIVPVRVSSSAGKFSVPCTHRDYLGSVLSLGIERSQIGDILTGDRHAFVLCKEHMADFLMENLTSVRKNPVVCKRASFSDLEGQVSFKELSGSVASVRLDSLVALMLGGSRSSASSCIRAERVFLNGVLCTSLTAVPKEGDVISVRGAGKFIYDGVQASTKKGRLMVRIRKYS